MGSKKGKRRRCDGEEGKAEERLKTRTWKEGRKLKAEKKDDGGKRDK